MFLSIFSDEVGLDIAEALPLIKSWGLEYVDLRSRVFGMAAEDLPAEKLPELRKLLDKYGMKVGCLQASLAKVHLPDAARQKREAAKLEGIIRCADALDCRLVRSFHYWQPPEDLLGELAVRPDEQQKVLDMFRPLAERAKQAGLILTFENCGAMPDEVFTMLDLLGVPTWGMAWDVHNTWDCDERRRGEDAYIRRMVRRSKLIHVKAQGAVAGYKGESIPYDKVLAACANAGIAGPISVETHNFDRAVGNIEMSRRVVEAVKKAWPTAAPGSSLFGEPRAAESISRAWESDPVGFAVVGLGMGHGRAKEIAKTPGTRLIGVCDLIEDRAKRTSDAAGAPYSTDFREWLDNDDVEVVFVLTPTGRHAEVAIPALEAGKHVITTKPMEASLAACDDMIRTAEKNGRLLAVDFSRRFTTNLVSLKAAVEAGRFGRLLSGDCALKIQRTMDYFRSDGGWRGTKRWDGGGVLSNQAIHHIDEMVFVLGVPAKVRCNAWTQAHEIEGEDLAAATWLYDSGLVVTLRATSSYPQSTWYVRFEIEGTKGAYTQAADGPVDRLDIRWFLDGAWSEKVPETVESKWISTADNVAGALRAGAELVCSGRDGRRTQSILDAMYRSAYEHGGDWVEPKPELK